MSRKPVVMFGDGRLARTLLYFLEHDSPYDVVAVAMDREWLESRLGTLVTWGPIIAFPFALIGSYVYRILQALVYALVGAPVLSALASYLPTLTALVQDPALVLREL